MSQTTVKNQNHARPARRAQKMHTKTNSNAILPPYGKYVDKYKQDAGLIVCVGSEAWKQAKSKSWIAGMPKVVFPFNGVPSHYKWPAHGRTVMICDFGQPESYQRLIELSGCLLKCGAIWVVLAINSHSITKTERLGMENTA